jgi:hypothetical protein
VIQLVIKDVILSPLRKVRIIRKWKILDDIFIFLTSVMLSITEVRVMEISPKGPFPDIMTFWSGLKGDN